MKNTNALIEHKTILVAGAASPIGNGIIRYFLKQGATIIAPAINQQDLTILKEIGDTINTGNLITQLAQLPDYDQGFDIAEATADKFGNIDIGISIFNSPPCNKPLSNALISDWLSMLDEELTPFFVSARIILQSMKQNRQGLYVSICDGSFFSAGKPTPFAKITSVVKMEMSKIFAEETESLNIKYRHLWINMTSKSQHDFSDNTGPALQIAELTGKKIMAMYLDNDVAGIVFQHLTPVLY